MTTSEQKELGELTAEIRGLRGDIRKIDTRLDVQSAEIGELKRVRDEGRGGAKAIALAKGFGTFVLAVLAALGLTKAGAI